MPKDITTAEQVKADMAAGKPLHEIEADNDHAELLRTEHQPQHVEPVVPQEEPEVKQLSCVLNGINIMLDALARGPQSELVHRAVQCGQHARGICAGLILLDTTGNPVDAAIGAMEKKGGE